VSPASWLVGLLPTVCQSARWLPPSFRVGGAKWVPGRATRCPVGHKVPGSRVADPFGTQRSTVRSGSAKHGSAVMAIHGSWVAQHLRRGKEPGGSFDAVRLNVGRKVDPWTGGFQGEGVVSAVADSATAPHGVQLLPSAVGTPWPSAFVVGELPRRSAALLPDLLPEGPASGVSRRHVAACRCSKGAGQRTYATPGDTGRHPDRATHNPKVVGSNPTPATK
jgi:hypothetical protein